MKTDGTFIYTANNLSPGDLFVNICGNKIHKFSHVKPGRHDVVVDTNGNTNGIVNCRWLDQVEYWCYKIEQESNNKNMQTNGRYITGLDELKPGDLFINAKRNNTAVLIFRCSKSISKCEDIKGGTNTLGNIRWLTDTEYFNYQTKNKTKKEETMSDLKTTNETAIQVAYNTVKSDGTDAAWRVAAKQAAKSVKAPVVAALQRTTLPTGVIGFFVSQFDTDNGEAVLAFVLGTVMGYVPQLGTDPKFIRLARELRVLGMDRFLSKVADVMLNPLREQFVEIVKAIPFETPAV
jgi:hypothetical protein